ncbi:MAG: hypothetical protein ABS892_01215, partial [Psychrobacillus sp.]
MELDIKKSANAYPCPDRQMEKSEEAAPQPPQLLSILIPRGKAVELDIKKSATAYLCRDRQMGKSE